MFIFSNNPGLWAGGALMTKSSDLACGSGTVAVATALVGQGRRFVGCELDPGHARAALCRVAEILDHGGTR